MKTKNEKVIAKALVYFITTVVLLIAFSELSYGQRDEQFPICKNYKDSCIYIGKTFIQNLSDKNFEDLANLFSDNILFRALIPPSLVISNEPNKTANYFKSWFNVDESEQYKVVDSKIDFFVDCLHISYVIFGTDKGNPYNVEQHLYCEILSGKIYKLSLVCSGFRKVDQK